MVDTILTNRPTEIVGKDMEMNELTIDEINEVNGGVIPLVAAAYHIIGGVIGAYSLGYAIGRQFHK